MVTDAPIPEKLRVEAGLLGPQHCGASQSRQDLWAEVPGHAGSRQIVKVTQCSVSTDMPSVTEVLFLNSFKVDSQAGKFLVPLFVSCM